jgi:hypothetical protein
MIAGHYMQAWSGIATFKAQPCTIYRYLMSASSVLQISMNGGEAWEELTAPEHATYPECSTCRPSDSCKLHLHGPSSWHYGAGGLLLGTRWRPHRKVAAGRTMHT